MASLIEEAIRLDVATPVAAIVGEAFDLAVAVRQPGSPPPRLEDLSQVASADGAVFSAEEEDIVMYRIEVAGSGFEVAPTCYVVRLRSGKNSRPCFFQVTP